VAGNRARLGDSSIIEGLRTNLSPPERKSGCIFFLGCVCLVHTAMWPPASLAGSSSTKRG